jgi:hypothetical protein
VETGGQEGEPEIRDEVRGARDEQLFASIFARSDKYGSQFVCFLNESLKLGMGTRSQLSQAFQPEQRLVAFLLDRPQFADEIGLGFRTLR